MLPGGLNRDRALALGGLAGLFLVGLLCLSLILGAGGDGDGGGTGGGERAQSPAGEEAAAETPTPTATPTPKPTPPPLTPEQREQRAAAAEQVRSQGFEPVSLRAYKPERTLRVLLGERDAAAAAAAGGPPGRRAFFFVGDALIRTDTEDASQDLRLGEQSPNAVALRYGLSSGETTTVRFVWNGTSLEPRTPVPPADQRQGSPQE